MKTLSLMLGAAALVVTGWTSIAAAGCKGGGKGALSAAQLDQVKMHSQTTKRQREKTPRYHRPRHLSLRLVEYNIP